MKVELSKKKKKAVGELGRLKVLSRAGWVLSTCASISFFACTGFLGGLGVLTVRFAAYFRNANIWWCDSSSNFYRELCIK